MPTDFKTGLIAGLVISAGILIFIAGRSRLNEKSQIVEKVSEESNVSLKGEGEVETRYSMDLQSGEILENRSENEGSGFDGDKGDFRFHVVEKGETLWEISKEYYGSSSGIDKIIRANRGLTSSNLRPGMRIRIPE